MRGRLAVLAGIALVSSACFGVEQEPDVPVEIDDQICQEGDLPEEFVLKTEGDFSPADLANGSDASLRERDLELAGMRGGRFNYWQRSNHDDPKVAGTEVVCQAIAFREGAEASAYFEGLTADAAILAAHGFAWLGAGPWTARDAGGITELLSRTFFLDRVQGDEPRHITIVASTSGLFVRMIFQTTNDNADSDLAAPIAAAIAGREAGAE